MLMAQLLRPINGEKDEIIGRYKVGDMVSLWFNPDEVFIFKKPKGLEKELSLG